MIFKSRSSNKWSTTAAWRTTLVMEVQRVTCWTAYMAWTLISLLVALGTCLCCQSSRWLSRKVVHACTLRHVQTIDVGLMNVCTLKRTLPFQVSCSQISTNSTFLVALILEGIASAVFWIAAALALILYRLNPEKQKKWAKSVARLQFTAAVGLVLAGSVWVAGLKDNKWIHHLCFPYEWSSNYVLNDGYAWWGECSPGWAVLGHMLCTLAGLLCPLFVTFITERIYDAPSTHFPI